MSERRNDGVELPPDHGDPQAEYRALTGSCGLADRPDRALVRVTGERAAEMVNGLVTNDVGSLGEAGRHALLLNAKGRVLTDLRVLPVGDGLLLDLPESGRANLLSTFQKYLPPIYARFEDLTRDWGVTGVYGPDAVRAVSAVDAVRDAVPTGHLQVRHRAADDGDLLVVRAHGLAGDGVELIGPRAALRELDDALVAAVRDVGGSRVGRRALEVARIEAGIPRYGQDMDEGNLAQETGLDEAISHEKGCYLGQEVVARIHFRGHVNRHLRGLRFRDRLPGPGARLEREDGGKEVGRVTSAAESPDLGPIGLGYVRREVEPPAEIRWVDEEGGAGRVEVLELPLRQGFEVDRTPG